ncbi:MAG: hypothetical protein JWM46_601 [Candidatus Kaiserbacteria bacterium]|nr:hypothetical protein [Candidatus Kaiserbacteria bacterium]
MSRRTTARGVTLIDTIVATSLMLVVFLGIAAAFNLSLDIVSNNKARGGAIALADERMEYIRSLTYAQVGTVGGIPSGVLAQSESLSLNGVSYVRRTLVLYGDDASDGTGVADGNSITADYKLVKVDVTWNSRTGARHIALVTRFSPAPGVESAVAGGTLTINVIDSASSPLFNAQLRIVNASTTPASAAIDLTTYTNASGTATFIGATSTGAYQVTVTKSGYSTAQTYSLTAVNTSPNPGHLTVSTNQTTTGTFAIDLLAQKTVQTLNQIVPGTWTDPFSDAAKIATSTNVSVSGGKASLIDTTSTGEVRSIAVAPSALMTWGTLTVTDTKPVGTLTRYRVYDAAGALIPDSQLSGNSAGFTSTSIDLSGVSTSTYPSLVFDSVLTGAASSTPSIDVWSVGYTYGGDPLPNVAFTMRGAKTTGSGPSGTVYKYNSALSSGSTGVLVLPGLEWDTYLITVAGTSTGYDIASACSPQPETLAAGASATTRLYFATHTVNSILIDVHVASSGVLLPGATVHLYKTGYSATSTADSCGQAFFSGLTSGTYSLDVSKSGYTTYTSPAANVAGTSRLSVSLN